MSHDWTKIWHFSKNWSLSRLDLTQLQLERIKPRSVSQTVLCISRETHHELRSRDSRFSARPRLWVYGVCWCAANRSKDHLQQCKNRQNYWRFSISHVLDMYDFIRPFNKGYIKIMAETCYITISTRRAAKSQSGSDVLCLEQGFSIIIL